MFKNNKMQTGQSAIYTTVQLLCEWQTYESGERQREGGRANSSRVGDTAEDNEELRTDVESADVNRCWAGTM